jgi:hypothetical protein
MYFDSALGANAFLYKEVGHFISLITLELYDHAFNLVLDDGAVAAE